MARAHFVKKARKDNPAVKKGESYWWWQFAFSPKQYSRTKPKPSQLTRSAYKSQCRAMVERIDEANIADGEELIDLRDEIVAEIEELRDECQCSLDNMPESLQYSPTGELLQERIDACENALSEIENIDEFDEEEPERDDFVEDCAMCDGTGEVPGDDDDTAIECDECDGAGETGEDEFELEHSNWLDRRENFVREKQDEMSMSAGECEY